MFPVQKNTEEQRLKISQSLQVAFTEIFTFLYYEIAKQIKLFLENPQNPSYTHQTRVKTREFRSCLLFVRPVLDKDEYKTINKKLKSIARLFADLRTIDVLISDWKKLRERNPDELRELSSLFNILKDKREVEQIKVFQKISDGFATDKLNDVGDWLEEAYWTRDAKKNVMDFSTPRLKKWYTCLVDDINESPLATLEEVHPLRVKIKEVRYVRYYLAPIIDEDFMVCLEQFKEWQDDMGAYCDAKVHISLLKGLNEEYSDNSLAFECGVLSGYMLENAARGIKRLEKQVLKL